jgi:hypothetical protein
MVELYLHFPIRRHGVVLFLYNLKANFNNETNMRYNELCIGTGQTISLTDFSD